jgi:hypothetical protein
MVFRTMLNWCAIGPFFVTVGGVLVVVIIVVIVEIDDLMIVLPRLHLASVALLPKRKVEIVAFNAHPILRTVIACLRAELRRLGV